MRRNILGEIREAAKSGESLLLQQMILDGWPEKLHDVPSILVPYFSVRDEVALVQILPTERPWQKFSCDLFTLDNCDYLITVDYFSNLYEVDRLHETSGKTVIQKLKAHFARHGIPDSIVSDSSPQLTSQEFQEFSDLWHIEHTQSIPSTRKWQSKGAVKSAKRLMRKAHEDKRDPYLALLGHCKTPNQTSGVSPAQALFSRRN